MVKKIEFYSYLHGGNPAKIDYTDNYSFRVYQQKFTLFKKIKNISFKSPIFYEFLEKGRVIHRCILYSNIFSNIMCGYFGFNVIGGCFTLDEYRGKGLFPDMISRIVSDFGNKIVIYVESSNLSSIKSIQKAGFYLDRKFIIYKIIGLSFYVKRIY